MPQRESHGEGTYFLTFTTYGTRLPGDDRGSTDRRRNTYTLPRDPPNPALRHAMAHALKSAPVVLSTHEREIAHATIRGLAERRDWHLRALNVRSNHVHAVVWAEEPPLQVIQGMKAWVTRELRSARLRQREEILWTKRGSCQYLWDELAILRAVDYVLFLQD